jgi:hypothetical protein
MGMYLKNQDSSSWLPWIQSSCTTFRFASRISGQLTRARQLCLIFREAELVQHLIFETRPHKKTTMANDESVYTWFICGTH